MIGVAQLMLFTGPAAQVRLARSEGAARIEDQLIHAGTPSRIAELAAQIAPIGPGKPPAGGLPLALADMAGLPPRPEGEPQDVPATAFIALQPQAISDRPRARSPPLA